MGQLSLDFAFIDNTTPSLDPGAPQLWTLLLLRAHAAQQRLQRVPRREKSR